MVNPQMVMYEEEFNQIQTVVDHLVKSANAKSVFIVDKNGQLIAASGDVVALELGLGGVGRGLSNEGHE